MVSGLNNKRLIINILHFHSFKLSALIYKATLVVAFILFCGDGVWGQVTGDYRTSGNGSWNVRTDWRRWDGDSWETPTNGQGYPGQNSAPGTVTIRNGHTIILNVSPGIGSLNVGEGTSGTLTIGSNNNNNRILTVSGNLTVSNSASLQVYDNTTNTRNHQLIIGGNLEINGTFDLNRDANGFCSTTFNGTAQTISGTGSIADFYNLTNTSGTLILERNIRIVEGNLTVNGGTFDLGTFAANRSTAGGTLTVAAGAALRIGGTNALPLNYSTYSLNNTSTVEYYGSNQTITVVNYSNLTSGNNSGTNSAGGNLIVNGTLTTTAGGTLDMGNYIFTSLTSIANNGTLSTSNTSALPLPTGRTWGGTIRYARLTGGQTIISGTYNNLEINNNSNSNTASGAITINSLFSGTDGGILNTLNNIDFNGTTSCGGSINATGGTVTYAATATNIIAGTYNNLTINGNATLCGNITVNGTLTLNGQLSTGNYNLVLNNTACGSGSINSTGGTITYSGNTGILPGTYNNLTVSAGAVATLCAGTTNVTGILNLQGATLNIGSATLSAAGVNRSNTNTINISTGTFTVNSNLVLSTSDPVNFTGAGFINVTGNFTCGALTGNAGTITLSGSFNPSSLVPGTSTVVFNGSGVQTIPALNYYNVTSSSTGNRILASAGITGISGIFTPGTNSYTLTGSTIDYNGTAAQSVAAFTYNNLAISGSNTKTLSGNITVNNNLAVSGTATLASDIYQITGNPDGNLSFLAGTTLTLGNAGDDTDVLFPLNYTNINLNAASAVIYQSSGSQTVAPLNYGNLEINGGGIKSLSGNVTVQTTLTLTNGNLSLGNFNLTVNNPLSGGFDGSHMIVTGGTGALVKNGTIAQASMVYPVGTGAKYTPVIISGSAGAASGHIYVRAVDGTSPNMLPGSASLSKYWEILTPDFILNSGNVTFSWHGTEVLGDPSSFSLSQWITGPAWEKRSSTLAGSSLTHALSGTISGEWTTTERAVLYSYTTGNWHNASTWTTDPTGTELVGSRVPQDDDRVVILNGYTVTLTQSVTTLSNSVRVEAGAILNLDTCRFLNNINLLEGSGTIQSSRVSGIPSTGYFPVADANTFVNANGGTYEYSYDGALESFNLPAQALYNNLKINNTSGKAAIIAGNITLKGNLVINSGTLRINDGSAVQRILTINGDMDIAGDGLLTVGSGNVTHNLRLYGNLTNIGTIDLTNNADYAVNTLGASNLTLTGTTESIVSVNGTTSFYGFIVDKGTDQSLTVEVLSDVATAPFDGNHASNVITLSNGTLKLGENITVNRLRNDVNNYDISTGQNGNAGLWINGANVTLGTSALVVYGNLRISRGSFNAMGMGQGSIVTREGGSIYIEGGNLTANQIRPSNTAVHTGSFILTDGTINVNGPATTPEYPVFAWPFPASQFHMSGGTLNVSGPTSGGTAINGGILIGVGPENYSITGGTVNVNIPASAVNFNINSTVPFWNLTISKAGAGAGTATLAVQPHGMVGVTSPVTAKPLVVLNNLTINGTNSPVLNAGGTDVTAGGNFTISNGGTYTPGSNSTIFNGAAAQALTNNGTITTGLNKFKINKISGALTLGGSTSTYTVLDSLIISQGTLNDGGKTITVAGNIYTAGIHAGTGRITMNSNGLRTIEASVFGNPSLGNLEINNSNGTAGFVATQLLSDLTVNSLTLTSNHIFDIGIYGLTVNMNTINGGAFSASRMIRTSGNSSDKGLTLNLAGQYTNSLIAHYPVGTALGYTPAEIRTNGNVSSGNISGTHTIIPVNEPHPAALDLLIIDYYWKSKTNISGAIHNNINTIFYFVENIPSWLWGFIRSYAWLINSPTGTINTGFDVSGGTDIPYVGRGFINSDYTAGNAVSFSELLIRTLYSRNTTALPRNWNDNDSWSETGHAGTDNAGAPNFWDNVVIGNDHTVYVTNNNNSCATLEIEEGSTLDLRTTTGHTFNVVTGSGKVRISSLGSPARFPTGDFGLFLGESGGFVEYYSIGAVDFTIPTRQGPTENLTPITNYRNLELTPAAGRTITMPNSDLEIYDTLTVQGADNSAIVRLNTATSRTLSINGSLRINSGNLQYRSGTVQNINIYQDLVIGNNAIFNVGTGGTAHHMVINGNLVNNGTFDMLTNGFCNVTFTGNTNNYITGTNPAAVSRFNNLIVNKGTSQSAILTANVAGTFSSPVNNWLTLTNGTFLYQNSSDLNISTTSSFTIPVTASLEIENASADVYMVNNVGSTNNLFLNGKLSVKAGNVFIGAGNGNDIEYSESGLSEINITGGSLTVSGQIRRNLVSLGGILKYIQTGGNVIIQGNNADASRAKLEVLNIGSNFTLTGGTLTLVRGGGTTFGDLYLRPSSHSTSAAGNIILATAAGSGNQTFNVEATIPLSGLTINGFDASNRANARIFMSPLVLNGGLSINSNGTFNTNNINLTLAGNFTNNGTFTPGTTDVTTFNGSVQTLTGNNTTFSNLTVQSSTSLTLQPSSNITVNRDLAILSGILADGGNTISVKRNLVNYTIHSTTGAGRILLNGSLNQVVSGSGSASPAIFGRLVIDNGAGALLQQDVTINNELVLESGSINIDERLITINTGASLNAGSGSFGISQMVIVNGAITTAKGITLPVPASAGTILVPVGVNGKYTPVTITCSSNSSAGTVNIIPLNSAHPTAIYPTDVLQYYWQITSTGLSGFTGNVQMNYIDSDVRVTPPNIESNYISGRLIGNTWTKLPGLVDATNNISEFSFSSATTSINGDYTAGVDSALPTTVPTYYSNVVNGNWGTPASWTPLPASGVPNGAIMVIQPGHNIVLETDGKKAYRTTINGRLEVGSTTKHYLGIVDGTGVMAVTEQKLPAGRYDPFFSCTGGALEYGDGGTPKDYTMSTIPSVLRRLILTGGGKRIMPNKDLTVCELLDIGDNTVLDNSVNNRTLYINGSMIRDADASFLSGIGANARVVFQGTSEQTLGTFTGANAFNHIQMNNNSGMVLNGPVDMKSNLTLTNGNITTTIANILYMSSGTSAIYPAGGSSSSFINGPMKKKITGGYMFHFPIGKGTRYGRASVNLPDDGDWTAEYFNTGHPGLASPAFSAPLTAASTTEYWTISGPPSKEAYVSLRWDPISDIRPAVSQSGIPGMRVAELNTTTSQWDEKPTNSSGNNSNGISTTRDKMNLDSHDYTLAVVGTINARARFVNPGNICIGGSIPVEITGVTGMYTYTISYSIDGVDQVDITGINAATTSIPVTVTGEYRLNGFSYNHPAAPAAGIYDETVITVNEQPSTADAGTDQAGFEMCGRITTTLDANVPATGTGRWSIISGSGGLLGNPALPQSTFSGTAGVTYVLRWTITNEPCIPETDEVTVSFHQAPAITLTGDDEVCSGDEGVVYSTTAGMSSYVWTISGGIITAGGNALSNTATVTWGASGVGHISVNYINISGCDADLPTEQDVNILKTPVTGPAYRFPNN